MKNLFLSCSVLLFLLLSFSASAQKDLELFEPLPQNIEKITAINYHFFREDTISSNLFEYNFNKNGKVTKWEYFTHHNPTKANLEYDALNRIKKIDILYGESFGSEILTYEYPTKNSKIEIQNKMGVYHYNKLDVIVSKNGRKRTEIQYDSSYNSMNSEFFAEKQVIQYFYDAEKKLVKIIMTLNDAKTIFYNRTIEYKKDRISKQIEEFFPPDTLENTSYLRKRIEETFYIEEGKFKDQLSQVTSVSIGENDSMKSEIKYTYTLLDSDTTKKEIYYFYKDEIASKQALFYYKDNLIKLEEYSNSRETQELKLQGWTKYSYLFYKKKK